MTDSYLGFRESVNESYLSANKFSDYPYPAGPEYGQGNWHALREIYGLDEPDTMVKKNNISLNVLQSKTNK